MLSCLLCATACKHRQGRAVKLNMFLSMFVTWHNMYIKLILENKWGGGLLTLAPGFSQRPSPASSGCRRRPLWSEIWGRKQRFMHTILILYDELHWGLWVSDKLKCRLLHDSMNTGWVFSLDLVANDGSGDVCATDLGAARDYLHWCFWKQVKVCCNEHAWERLSNSLEILKMS